MDNLFGIKEFYDVIIKNNYPFKIGGRTIEEGEVIASFDKISIANFSEALKLIAAKGGFENQTRVIWEQTKEIDLVFTQGIFSQTQLALISNSKLVPSKDESFLISVEEKLESNEEGIVTLKYPCSFPLFVYDSKTGEKLSDFKYDPASGEGEKDTITLNEPYKDVLVRYSYNYPNAAKTLELGNKLLQGFVSLEGRTKIKEDVTGIVKTGIIKIPKLKIISNLTLRLGSNASPAVGTFQGIGYPVGERGNLKVMELTFLDEDIDSDIN